MLLLWIVGAFVAACNIATALVIILQCLPVESNWNREMKARCINFPAALTAFAAVNVLTDVTILVLPIPLIWALQTTTARKIQLTGLFSLVGL